MFGRLETMDTSPETIKKASFGICDFTRTSPRLADLSPDTKVLNIEITFEEALKLNLAIDDCVHRLNSYNRGRITGKRTCSNLAIHLSRGVITVLEGKLAAKQ